jgi:hypothetical protein
LFELGSVAMNLESTTVRDPVEIKAVLLKVSACSFRLARRAYEIYSTRAGIGIYGRSLIKCSKA